LLSRFLSGARSTQSPPTAASRPVPRPSRCTRNTHRAALRPNPDHTHELLAEAARLLEGTATLKTASYKIGRKPIPGDGEPVFGALRKVPGCYVAFTHSGATLALIAGVLVAAEIITGHEHPMLTTYRPERFTD
jgi:glycine/D-amino acid oxidase-like deaminating enzyme